MENIDRYTDGLIFTIRMQKIVETLINAKSFKKDGKENTYADHRSDADGIKEGT